MRLWLAAVTIWLNFTSLDMELNGVFVPNNTFACARRSPTLADIARSNKTSPSEKSRLLIERVDLST